MSQVKDQKAVDVKSAAAAATRAPVPAPVPASQVPQAGPSVAERLKTSYREFNQRTLTFLGDMERVYGKESPAIGKVRGECEIFLKHDPARTLLANKAWPQFRDHRELIDKRNTDVFFKLDLCGMRAKFGLETKALWAKATPNSKEAMWRAVEDFMDLLININDIRPIPTDDDATGPATTTGEKKSGSSGNEQPSWLNSIPSTASVTDDEEEADAESEEAGGPGGSDTAGFTRKLMTNLKDLIGAEDSSVDSDFEKILSKMNEGDDSKAPGPEEQEIMTRILHKFIDRITPTDEEAEADMAGMSEAEKEAAHARRSLHDIQYWKKLKRAIGRFTSNETLQQTTDPDILESERQEAAAEAERQKNPEKQREFTITAHFNHKALKFLNKMLEKRGRVRRISTNKLAFPMIKESFVLMLEEFKTNPGSERFMKPFAQWVDSHRAQLLDRDDNLFLKPDHPALVRLNSKALWETFKPEERRNFWGRVGQILQLATIFYYLDNDELRDISDIVNDLLAGAQIAYDRDPKSLNAKEVLSTALLRGCSPGKTKKLWTLFEKMQKERDGKTLTAITNLIQNAVRQGAPMAKLGPKAKGPQGQSAAGAAAGDEEADDNFESESSARKNQIADAFDKILKTMPALGKAAKAADDKSKSDKSNKSDKGDAKSEAKAKPGTAAERDRPSD